MKKDLYLDFDSKIPDNLEDLIKLSWVWIKTAKVVLWVLHNAPYIAVDTHVHRVMNRLWIVSTKTPEETDKEIHKILSEKQKTNSHHALVLFWRYICKAKKPDCKNCSLQKNCKYFLEKN